MEDQKTINKNLLDAMEDQKTTNKDLQDANKSLKDLVSEHEERLNIIQPREGWVRNHNH